jgi:beta-lactamase class A
VAFKDLQSGETLYVNAKQSFHAASTMKTPVMVEIFKQVQMGKFTLDDSIPVRNEFKSIVDGSPYSLEISSDSDDRMYQLIGKKSTVRNLLDVMINVSSNLATNILIDKVDPVNVMRTMKSYGLNDIQVLRGVEDGKAFKDGRNNTTTAYDLAMLYTAIAEKTCVSQQASEEMVKILASQKFKDMIPAMLPKDVVVAHKTGSITNVQHDAGIIFLPDGRSYVLVVLSKDLRSNKEGIHVIAQISKAVYNYMME